MADRDKKPIRIFVSSPSDVRRERRIARRVIVRLAREFAAHFEVKPVMWEREALLASESFQAGIAKPRETDIVIVLLWSRLGVRLAPQDQPGPLSGRDVTGTEWEFEDALKSARQGGNPQLLLYRKTEKVTVDLDDPQLAEHQEQKRQVEDFIHRWTRDAKTHAFTAAFWPFADTTEFELLVEQHLRSLLGQRLAGASEVSDDVRWHKGSPFRGLEAFEPEHEPVFFGRTRARNELVDLLGRQIERKSAFVLVLGASGSGKSSLVRAGLVPDLRDAGVIGRVGHVRFAILKPSDRPPGTSDDWEPIDTLGHVLLADTALPELAADPFSYSGEWLAGQLKGDPAQAVQPIRQGLVAASKKAELSEAGEARLLLVVDQLEELFTLEGVDAPRRRRFLAALQALAESGIVWVVATMRSDFLARLERAPTLRTLAAGEAKYFLSPPDAEEIAQIVQQPAREAGLTFERDAVSGRGLADVIIGAASREAGSLPLLEYLLDQLWSRRSPGRMLTFAAYHELGGLEGAIGARAAETLASLPPAIQASFPRVLRALTTVGEGAEAAATARRAEIGRFATGAPERALVDALLHPNARLLVVDGDRVRVAHEALLTHWQLARDQIAADRSDLQQRARLESLALHWRGAPAEHRKSFLLEEGLPLSQAVDLAARRGEEFDDLLRRYVDASVDRARTRTRRRRMIRFGSVAAAILIAIGFGVLAQRADDASRKSAQSFEAAAQALSALVEIVPDRVEPVAPLSTVGALLDEAERAIKRLPQAAVEANPVVYDYRGWIAISLSDILYDLAQYREMRVHAGNARSDFENARKLFPDNRRVRAGLARAHQAIGRSYKELGDGDDKARASYEQALKLFDDHIRQHPADPQILRWRLMRADVLQDLGDLLLVRFKQVDAAATVFEECLRERRALEKDSLATTGPGRIDPSVVHWSIGWSVNKIGDIHQARGQRKEALKTFKEARDIIAELGSSLQTNKHWLHYLAIIHNNIGLLQREEGAWEPSIASFMAGAEITRELLKRDPDNKYVRSNLGWSLDNAGETWLMRAWLESDPETRVVYAAKAQGPLDEALVLRATLADKPQWTADLRYTESNRAARDGLAAQLVRNYRLAAEKLIAAADQARTIAGETNRDDHVLRAVRLRTWAADALIEAGDAVAGRQQLQLALQTIDGTTSPTKPEALAAARRQVEALLARQ